jgi:hypothetical protein
MIKSTVPDPMPLFSAGATRFDVLVRLRVRDLLLARIGRDHAIEH